MLLSSLIDRLENRSNRRKYFDRSRASYCETIAFEIILELLGGVEKLNISDV